MRIAKLYMDAQDKTRFEIQGKSSVKYHLKANHVVEAKRWFWALNNAIQWTKDEAKEEAKQKQRKEEMLRQAMSGKTPQVPESVKDPATAEGSKLSSKGLAPAPVIGTPLTATSSRVSLQESLHGAGSTLGDDDGSQYDDQSVAGNEAQRSVKDGGGVAIPADPDDDEEYGDDASSRELQPTSKDAFNITAHSASLQLNLLSQVSTALQAESGKENAVSVSDPTVVQALSTYDSAVASLQGLVNDLLKISRDRDAYWQYRLDREADVRKLWEESMARVAQEQEELEGRIEESEEKRKRTKRALKDALEGNEDDETTMVESPEKIQLNRSGTAISSRKSIAPRDLARRKSVIADLTNLSDSDSDQDEEFFDAVDAGEVQVVEAMPTSPVTSPDTTKQSMDGAVVADLRERKTDEIKPSFRGYEDPIRTRLQMEADNRPKISLWVKFVITQPGSWTDRRIGHPQINDWQGHDENDSTSLIQ